MEQSSTIQKHSLVIVIATIAADMVETINTCWTTPKSIECIKIGSDPSKKFVWQSCGKAIRQSGGEADTTPHLLPLWLPFFAQVTEMMGADQDIGRHVGNVATFLKQD